VRANSVGDVLQTEKIELARWQWEQESTVNVQVQVQPPSSRKGAGLGSRSTVFIWGTWHPEEVVQKLFQCNENRCFRSFRCFRLWTLNALCSVAMCLDPASRTE
jgi:hypothetical protein